MTPKDYYAPEYPSALSSRNSPRYRPVIVLGDDSISLAENSSPAPKTSKIFFQPRVIAQEADIAVVLERLCQRLNSGQLKQGILFVAKQPEHLMKTLRSRLDLLVPQGKLTEDAYSKLTLKYVENATDSSFCELEDTGSTPSFVAEDNKQLFRMIDTPEYSMPGIGEDRKGKKKHG